MKVRARDVRADTLVVSPSNHEHSQRSFFDTLRTSGIGLKARVRDE